LLLPANPSLGRTIRDGRYFIHGKPIHRTDFAHDPEYPRRSANVLRLLAEAGSVPIRVLHRDEAFSPAGIFIGEVSSPADVKRWVARHEPDMLLAGGAETFGAALQERLPGTQAGSKRAGRDASAPRGGGQLFVCGSASEACCEFVQQSRRNAVPVIALPEELAWWSVLPRAAKRVVVERVSAAVRASGRAILHVGLPQIHERAVARRLAEHLAALAAEVLSARQVCHVFAEGGQTAAALLRRMGWVRLRVLHELAPGVATLEPLGVTGIWLTMKPGSYRWPASVTRLRRRP
jgi:uncharacterized protein YgbK (DUF1537 family)